MAGLIVAGAGGAATVPVPPGDFLVCKGAGQLVVMSPRGAAVGTVAARAPCAQGIVLAADRRTAYVSALNGEDDPPSLVELDLSTGATHVVASGVAPALSPDGRTLAYIATAEAPAGGYYTPTGLALRDLASGTTKLLAPPPRSGLAPPWPEGPLNWSADGKTLAVFAGDRIRLVDVATATDLESQPPVRGDVPNHRISKRVYPGGPPPGGSSTAPPPGLPVITITTTPPTPTTATSKAPVYLDQHTLVAVYDCCVGLSHLVAFDLRTGRRSTFATLYGPPTSMVRVGPGRLLVVTAAGLLVIATHGHTQQLATGVAAATG